MHSIIKGYAQESTNNRYNKTFNFDIQINITQVIKIYHFTVNIY